MRDTTREKKKQRGLGGGRRTRKTGPHHLQSSPEKKSQKLMEVSKKSVKNPKRKKKNHKQPKTETLLGQRKESKKGGYEGRILGNA